MSDFTTKSVAPLNVDRSETLGNSAGDDGRGRLHVKVANILGEPIVVSLSTDSVVTSLNGLHGDVAVVSTDNSVMINTVGQNVDLSVVPPTWGNITGTLSNQTDLQSALNAKQSTSEKDQPNGYPSLDVSGLIPASEIPSVPATKVDVSTIGTPTYKTVQDMYTVMASAGLIAGGIVTSNGNGTVAVTAGSVLLRTADSETASVVSTDFSAVASLSLVDQAESYIYVDYNAGSPAVMASTTRNNIHTTATLATAYRNGTSVFVNQTNATEITDSIRHSIQFNKSIMPYAHESGASISATGTRNFALTSGVFWQGLKEFSTNSFNSATTGTFTYYYSNGLGGWASIPSQTQINNTQYDDGSGTLATLSNNNYGVHWVYMLTDSSVIVVFGRGSYTLTQAQGAQPDGVPPIIAAGGFLVGKIIIQKSASVFTSVDSAFAITFTSSAPPNHNELSGLQGGTTNEYYHLTNANYSDVVNATNTNTPSTLVKRDASGNFASNILTLANGTTSAVSLRSTTQANSGIRFFAGAGSAVAIGFVSNGTEMFFVDANTGNGVPYTSFPWTNLYGDGAVNQLSWGFLNNGGLGVYRSAANEMTFAASTADRFRVGAYGVKIVSALRLNPISQAGSYTITTTGNYIRYTGAGGDTFTLPAATGTGQKITIKNTGSGSLTVSRAGTDTIDGSTTVTVSALGYLKLIDGASGVWDVI